MTTMLRQSENADPGNLAEFGEFTRRHIGPSDDDIQAMLSMLGFTSLQQMVEATIPASIRFKGQLSNPPLSEHQALTSIRRLAERVTEGSHTGVGCWREQETAKMSERLPRTAAIRTSAGSYVSSITPHTKG